MNHAVKEIYMTVNFGVFCHSVGANRTLIMNMKQIWADLEDNPGSASYLLCYFGQISFWALLYICLN